jgi:putative PIN family toxin of toxin-antitoxin system
VPRLTLDANIFISALVFGGKPEQLLEMALRGEVEIFISDEIVAEISRVLARPKFGLNVEEIAEAQHYIDKCTKRVTPTMKLNVVESDPDDNKIVECAVESGSEAIVTHDKDLIRMGSYQGIEMIKVGAFLHRVQGQGR